MNFTVINIHEFWPIKKRSCYRFAEEQMDSIRGKNFVSNETGGATPVLQVYIFNYICYRSHRVKTVEKSKKKNREERVKKQEREQSPAA